MAGRLADLFDRVTPQPFFKGSKVPELEELALTETQLLEQTAALLGASLAQLVKAGTLVYAKREFLPNPRIMTPPRLRACLKSHVLAESRLVINWIMAIRIHVSVVSGKASKSLLNRRERLSQPKVRSTIQRHCSTRNPCVLRGRFTIERVQCKTVATQSTSFPP